MVLVAFLMMRGHNQQNMVHDDSGNVQWEFTRSDELDRLVKDFNESAVSVHVPALWKLFGNVREQMFQYMENNNLRY
jgi:Domain of unknown function (DUF5659)